MAGIKISFIEDVSSFLRGTESAERALDDVASSLDELAADAQRQSREAGDALTRGLEAGAQDAERAVTGVNDAVTGLSRTVDQHADTAGRNLARGVDAGADTATDSVQQLERSFRDLAGGVRRDANAAGDDLGASVRRGAQEASEGTDALRENAGANAKEVAASFDGSANSIADGFQGLAAEAFEGFGPAGLAAGVAVAAGIGLITSGMQKAKEEAQETAEGIADVAGELIDLGSLKLDNSNVLDNLKEAATTAEDGKVRLNEWADAARKAGVDFTTYARGLAGDSESLKASYAEVTAKQRALDEGLGEFVRTYNGAGDAATVYYGKTFDVARALDKARESLEAQDGSLNQASETAQRFNEVSAGLADTTANTTAQLGAQRDTTADLTRTTADATAQHAEYSAALEASADPVAVFTGLLADEQAALDESARKTAASSASKTDSMETYASKAKVTTNDLIKEWNRQAREAEQFEANLAEIAANGGQALADELRAKGPEVAGAVAEVIAKAGPEKQRKAIDAHARATGQDISKAAADGIRDSSDKVAGAVQAVISGIPTPTVPVDVDLTAAKRTLNAWSPRVTVSPRLGKPVQ